MQRITPEEIEELRWHADQWARERALINEPELGYDLPRKMLGRLLDEIAELKYQNEQLRMKNERLSDGCLALGEELEELKQQEETRDWPNSWEGDA